MASNGWESAPVFKHVSLDLWKTLVNHNPAYRLARAKLLNAALGTDQSEELYARFERFVNHNLPLKNRLPQLCELLLIARRIVHPTRCFELAHQLEELFIEPSHRPLIDSNVLGQLAVLRARGVTLSVSSNVTAMSGRTVKTACSTLMPFMDFWVFDDEIGFSKPHPTFFQEVITRARHLHPSLSLAEIVHIGDDPIADGGARDIGIATVIVKDTEYLKATLSEIISRTA